jgi:hypothetical protein
VGPVDLVSRRPRMNESAEVVRPKNIAGGDSGAAKCCLDSPDGRCIGDSRAIRGGWLRPE